ncbi:MAG TPA: phage holin family protein [Longimicrobiaceae bacterium]|nr:phage holin family protein [Longimicrobiaceae bacterium]
MAVQRDIYLTPESSNGPPVQGGGPVDRAKDEANSLKVLFRRLADDATTLMREEMALAKLEMRREARAITADLVKVGVALGLALLGALAMTAFLILVIGTLLDAFWAGALIVGAVFLIIGGLMARNATNDLANRSLKPEDTVETLRDDKRWAKRELQDLKSGGATQHTH